LPDSVEEILSGDQVVALAYVTPMKGVVLTPMTNFGPPAPLNSSVAASGKLKRMRKNPRIALVYHTRLHGFSDRPELVLVQGQAVLGQGDPDYPAANRERWERFGGPADFGWAWGRWLRIWRNRLDIGIEVTRVMVWPDLDASGLPVVHGPALPGPPQSQRPPAKGTGPRVPHRRAARRLARLHNLLLGWVQADGFPMVVPVRIRAATERGIELEGTVPAGARRAGLMAHEFERYTFGQRLRKHTGWLEHDERGLVYSPHTESGYAFPASRRLFYLLAGGMTRWEARRNRLEAREAQSA
jgi:hypothetical protein